MASPGRDENRRVGLAQATRRVECFFSGPMIKTLLQITLQSTELLRAIVPESEIRITLTEFRNKLQAFYLFQHVDSVLDLSAADLSLSEMLGRALALGPFRSVWATEGLGHYYTGQRITVNTPARLLWSASGHLPPANLVPLHAGMGLALAESLLKHKQNSRALASQFLQLCRNNARKEYLGAAIEPLGLVVRNLCPEWLAHLDREFSQMNEELLAYFWHGVGRGIYFTPANSLPWIPPWQGYQMCLQEPPHRLGKMNAVAGFAWALTLVNIQCPQVLAAFLKHHGANLGHDDAFLNGICSALAIWLESAPDDVSVQALLSYQPEQSAPSLASLWDHYVRQPCNYALHHHALIRSKEQVGELFRYHSLRASRVT